MMLLLPVYVNEFKLLQNSPYPLGFIVLEVLLILYYAALFLHVSVSFSKALITLGWLCDNAKRKALDRAM